MYTEHSLTGFSLPGTVAVLSASAILLLNNMLKAVIRVGDYTSHGGVVVTGDQTLSAYGRPVARKGDMVTCPKCGGIHPIVDGAPALGSDRPIALEGMRTACGASLIASQHFWMHEYGQGSSMTSLRDNTENVQASSLSSTDLNLATALCDHPDDADPIAEWLAARMNENPFTDAGIEITAANDYDVAADSAEWNARPWYQRIGGTPDFDARAAGWLSAAYSEWTAKVAPGMEWDYKGTIRDNFPVHSDPGWHKHGDYDYFIDIWANIHYGYVGMAVGFDSDVLIAGAGLAQWGFDAIKNTIKGRRPLTQNHPSNGPWPRSADDVEDNISIKLGIDLFADVKPGAVTKTVLLDRIASVPIPWGEPPGGSKRPHKCVTQ